MRTLFLITAALALAGCSALESISKKQTDSNGKLCAIESHTNAGILWDCPDGKPVLWPDMSVRG